jgi:hypothetical protein
MWSGAWFCDQQVEDSLQVVLATYMEIGVLNRKDPPRISNAHGNWNVEKRVPVLIPFLYYVLGFLYYVSAPQWCLAPIP